MKREKISIGLPYYGGFSGEWVAHMLHFTASLQQNHDIVEVIAVGVMTADHNRNTVVDEFLKSDAEWLFWIDSDTIVPAGAVERMLKVGQPLVSGLYYGKNPPHMPIAYNIYNGAFAPIDKTIRWERGEIFKVDAVGMGCMLTHRSVFEKIKEMYRVFQVEGGGIVTVHKDDVESFGKETADDDNHVVAGQLKYRLIEPTLEGLKFPFFMVQYIRTEDMFFFDMCRRLGYEIFVDSSIECSHQRIKGFTGADYREINGH